MLRILFIVWKTGSSEDKVYILVWIFLHAVASDSIPFVFLKQPELLRLGLDQQSLHPHNGSIDCFADDKYINLYIAYAVYGYIF